MSSIDPTRHALLSRDTANEEGKLEDA